MTTSDKLLSKEEIKSANSIYFLDGGECIMFNDKNINAAMEQYAQQESKNTAIEFLDWVEDNYSVPYEGFSITRCRGEESYVWENREKVYLSKLYELYLKSLNK